MIGFLTLGLLLPIMQGYDYVALRQYVTSCKSVVSQWEILIAGTELLRRKADKTGHVIMFHSSDASTTGKKFGKPEGNAVGLTLKDFSIRNVPILDEWWMLTLFASWKSLLSSLDEIEDIWRVWSGLERLAQKVLARKRTLFTEEEATKSLNITEQFLQETSKPFVKEELKQGLVEPIHWHKQKKTTISWNSSCHLVWWIQNAKPVKTSKTELSSTATASKTLTMSWVTQMLENELTVIRREEETFVLTY